MMIYFRKGNDDGLKRPELSVVGCGFSLGNVEYLDINLDL